MVVQYSIVSYRIVSYYIMYDYSVVLISQVCHHACGRSFIYTCMFVCICMWSTSVCFACSYIFFTHLPRGLIQYYTTNECVLVRASLPPNDRSYYVTLCLALPIFSPFIITYTLHTYTSTILSVYSVFDKASATRQNYKFQLLTAIPDT